MPSVAAIGSALKPTMAMALMPPNSRQAASVIAIAGARPKPLRSSAPKIAAAHARPSSRSRDRRRRRAARSEAKAPISIGIATNWPTMVMLLADRKRGPISASPTTITTMISVMPMLPTGPVRMSRTGWCAMRRRRRPDGLRRACRSSRHPLLAVAVDRDGDDQDRALEDRLPVRAESRRRPATSAPSTGSRR